MSFYGDSNWQMCYRLMSKKRVVAPVRNHGSKYSNNGSSYDLTPRMMKVNDSRQRQVKWYDEWQYENDKGLPKVTGHLEGL